MAESAPQNPTDAQAGTQESALETYRTHREVLRAQLRDLVGVRASSAQPLRQPTEAVAASSASEYASTTGHEPRTAGAVEPADSRPAGDVPSGGDNGASESGTPELGFREVAALAAACIEFSRTAEATTAAFGKPAAESILTERRRTDDAPPDVPRDLLADARRNIRQILAQVRPSWMGQPDSATPREPHAVPDSADRAVSASPAPAVLRVPHALPLSPSLRGYVWSHPATRYVVPLLTLALGVVIGARGWVGPADETASQDATTRAAAQLVDMPGAQLPEQVATTTDTAVAETASLPVQEPSRRAPNVADGPIVPTRSASGAETQAAIRVLAAAAEHWFEAYYRGGQLDSGGRRPRIVDERLPHERVPPGIGDVTRTFEQVQLQVMGDDALYTARMLERAQEGNRATAHVALVSQVWTREAGGWRLSDVQLVSDSRLRNP
jgi:hypothetical protein